MDALYLSAPASWSELSQQQLEFLLRTIVAVNQLNIDKHFRSADDFSAQTTAQVAVCCLLRWNNIKIITPYADDWLISHHSRELRVSTADIAAAAAAMDWISDIPDLPVRLDSIDGASAVDADLDDSFSFDDWLSCEALWQGYQIAKSEHFLQQMAEILYRKPAITLLEHQTLSIFYWWAGLKNLCNRLYPHFFQPASAEAREAPDKNMLRRNMDAQIRALTKGDITKEEQILALPAHRALTELDALAREYEELNRKYPAK